MSRCVEHFGISPLPVKRDTYGLGFKFHGDRMYLPVSSRPAGPPHGQKETTTAKKKNDEGDISIISDESGQRM